MFRAAVCKLHSLQASPFVLSQLAIRRQLTEIFVFEIRLQPRINIASGSVLPESNDLRINADVTDVFLVALRAGFRGRAVRSVGLSILS